MNDPLTTSAVFRGKIVVEPYPYCPICGDALRPDAWTSLNHFAICTQGTCVDGKFWKPVIDFILSNIDRIPLTERYGLHWYTPRNPVTDVLSQFRTAQISQSLPLIEAIGCRSVPSVNATS